MPTPIPNIWQLQSKNDIDALILALRHSDAGVRRGAAAALRALGAWQAVPALQAALAVENDWQAHAAITAALQYLDRDIHIETMVKNRDVRGLSKMLNSPKVEDLIAACKALGEIGDRQGVEPLVMVFRNAMLPNKVRLAAAEALLELESAPAVVTLLGALRRADNWQVRRNAAAVLGQLQAAWATDALIKALEDENQLVRRTAAAALRRFGTPEAVHAAVLFESTLRKTGELTMPTLSESMPPDARPQEPKKPSDVKLDANAAKPAETSTSKPAQPPTGSTQPLKPTTPLPIVPPAAIPATPVSQPSVPVTSPQVPQPSTEAKSITVKESAPIVPPATIPAPPVSQSSDPVSSPHVPQPITVKESAPVVPPAAIPAAPVSQSSDPVTNPQIPQPSAEPKPLATQESAPVVPAAAPVSQSSDPVTNPQIPQPSAKVEPVATQESSPVVPPTSPTQSHEDA